MRCGSCDTRYEGSWFAHTRSREHQNWFRVTGQIMARQLNELDRAYAGAAEYQKRRANGQLGMFE